MDQKKTQGMKKINKLYRRVTKDLLVGREEYGRKEWEVISPFWEALITHIPDNGDAALLFPMLEEALVLRIFSYRLLPKLNTEDQSENNHEEESPLDKLKVEEWIKTQERLRKVMKEILKQYGHSSTAQPTSLAEIMGPILELGEGILEDALEFEARKKPVQKTQRESNGDRGLAPLT